MHAVGSEFAACAASARTRAAMPLFCTSATSARVVAISAAVSSARIRVWRIKRSRPAPRRSPRSARSRAGSGGPAAIAKSRYRLVSLGTRMSPAFSALIEADCGGNKKGSLPAMVSRSKTESGFPSHRAVFSPDFLVGNGLPGHENGPWFASVLGFRRFSANLRAHELATTAGIVCPLFAFRSHTGNDQALRSSSCRPRSVWRLCCAASPMSAAWPSRRRRADDYFRRSGIDDDVFPRQRTCSGDDSAPARRQCALHHPTTRPQRSNATTAGSGHRRHR